MIQEMTGKLILDTRCNKWCQLPYPNHPQGCPNYGKRSYCPPHAPPLSKFIDLNKPHWFIINRFNLQEHIEKMRTKHPSWSERRLCCVLYWQTHIRRMLRDEIKSFQLTHPDTKFTLLPEAMGVNVISTALKNNINLEIKPKKIVTKIALIGYA